MISSNAGTDVLPPNIMYSLSSHQPSQLSSSSSPIMQQYHLPMYSKSRDGGYRNIPNDLSSIDQSPNRNVLMTAGVTGFENQHPNMLLEDEHPFKRPKLHLFKKDASRRIKTSSATRNLQPIYPLESLMPLQSKQAAFNSINVGAPASTGEGLLLQASPKNDYYYNHQGSSVSSTYFSNKSSSKPET